MIEFNRFRKALNPKTLGFHKKKKKNSHKIDSTRKSKKSSFHVLQKFPYERTFLSSVTVKKMYPNRKEKNYYLIFHLGQSNFMEYPLFKKSLSGYIKQLVYIGKKARQNKYFFVCRISTLFLFSFSFFVRKYITLVLMLIFYCICRK